MLDFDSFQRYIADNIKDHLPEEFADATVSLNTVTKNNGTQLHGMTIRTEGNEVCPNIYLDQFYENYTEHGMDIDVIMDHVAKLELEHMDPELGITNVAEKFMDVDFIKDHVVVALVNAEKNAEMLRDTPHKMTEDLAVIYKVMLSNGGPMGTATVTIKEQHMKNWDITLDELHECAVKNSRELLPVKVQDMGSLIREMMGMAGDDLIPEASAEEMMYVISNEQKVNGASSIIYSDVLEKLSEKLDSSLYILPSSVHELIAVPSYGSTPDVLAQMVKEVNATQVSPEEQLSDHVYMYDFRTKSLSIADTYAERREASMVSENKQSYEAANTEVSRPRHHR